ncbi:hypothetical protein HNQ60_004309 [Povalibacter uvarum]|uniref:Uncharacterized protein n=1 Tax=Povalibacter uvarum TaxID=732238 RepID=A0A841HSY9_9GAMM|nr:hypothetical protein [Povalibacter uvarum]MBB6095419.1 hypothetical protein [Povalibacter uvarum]
MKLRQAELEAGISTLCAAHAHESGLRSLSSLVVYRKRGVIVVACHRASIDGL